MKFFRTVVGDRPVGDFLTRNFMTITKFRFFFLILEKSVSYFLDNFERKTIVRGSLVRCMVFAEKITSLQMYAP